MLAKRLFDFFFSIAGLLLLAPLWIAIALWIKFDSPGPVLFRQVRVGKEGQLFRILKFRTMVVDAEARGLKVTTGNDARITRSGHLLRKLKLDELPQLINVILGEMSLVGPRPEVPEYMDQYPEDIRHRVLSVPPGLTDYAAIEFRNENEMLQGVENPGQVYIEEILPIKWKYYLKYVDERTFWLDVRLIFKTIKAIVADR